MGATAISAQGSTWYQYLICVYACICVRPQDIIPEVICVSGIHVCVSVCDRGCSFPCNHTGIYEYGLGCAIPYSHIGMCVYVCDHGCAILCSHTGVCV